MLPIFLQAIVVYNLRFRLRIRVPKLIIRIFRIPLLFFNDIGYEVVFISLEMFDE